METTLKTRQLRTTIEKPAAHTALNARKSWANAEYNRFGIIPVLLVIIACAGGIAAAFGAKGDVVRLSLTAFPTILSLALTLAVAPMRLIIRVSSIAVILDILVLIF